jgi:hypothetical protein
LHRSGVAAYLAALGLTGRGVELAGYPESGPAPVVISCETGDAVDDLRCELADGTSLLLQAKRTCGVDGNLASTVDQWVRQLPDLQAGERIGLVTAHTQGRVRVLGAALSRRQRPYSGPASPAERRALDAVRERLPPGTSPDAGEAVLDVALVMTVAAETEQDPDFRYAAALLDGTVVPAGSGSAAIRALQRAFQEQAAAGAGSGTGVLLTTRDSGLAASGKLGFPQARLTEPSFLEVAAGILLRHAAQHRVPEPERDRWVEQRERWLAEIRKDHGDLWRIPLLAILFTLLAAGRHAGRLPGSRARLLTEVVHHSVARWELARPTATPGGQADSMRPEMLTDGFAEIGHAVAGPGSCAPGDVRRAVAGMLSSRWGLALGDADARAGDVLSFWDDQVGVFVSVPPTGEIEARSRVFSEIGDAMWAARQHLDTQRAWVGAALADEDRREPLLLAASLSDQMAEILAAEALGVAAGQEKALLLAADATHGGAVLAPETMAAVLAALVDMAGHPPAGKWPDDCPDLPGETSLANHGSQEEPGDAAWPYVRRAAMLRLPDSLRDERRRLLGGLMLAGDQAVVAAALTALADAADSRATLRADDAAAVGELLDTAISADHRKLLPGHITAADQAITYLPQLGPGAPAAIYRIARHGSFRGYMRVEEQLTALGFTDADAREMGTGLAVPVIGIPDPRDAWDTLFEAAAAASGPRPLTATEQWRLPELAALSDVLDPLEATLVGIDAAFTTDRERLPGWIRATARAAGIDLPGLAGQAAAALAAWRAGDRVVADVMMAPPVSPPPACDITRLDEDDIAVLIDALEATSEWLADVACALLLTGRDPAIGQRVAGCHPGMSASRRRNAGVVVIANDPDPAGAAQRMLDSADPPTRIAAAIAPGILAGRSSSGETWAAVIARALADDDLTVRLACQDEADREDAVFWSCPRCAHTNDIDTTVCAACGRDRGQRDLRLPRLAQVLSRPAVLAAGTRT